MKISFRHQKVVSAQEIGQYIQSNNYLSKHLQAISVRILGLTRMCNPVEILQSCVSHRCSDVNRLRCSVHEWRSYSTRRSSHINSQSLFLQSARNVVQSTAQLHYATEQLLCALKWRHYERNGVSNHQPYDCLFIRLFKSQLKENIKAPRYSPLWGDFTGDRWIPCTKGQ